MQKLALPHPKNTFNNATHGRTLLNRFAPSLSLQRVQGQFQGTVCAVVKEARGGRKFQRTLLFTERGQEMWPVCFLPAQSHSGPAKQ